MDKIKEERIEIGFSFDPGIFSVLGERKYSSYMEALNEIVRNSIGYKAKKININISNEKIVIEDDGIGMNFNDLKDEYFRVGKPTQEPSTGSLFGIGKFGNQALAHKTELITQKQGETDKWLVSIDWDKAAQAREIESTHPEAYKPDVRRIASQIGAHGTTVFLYDLKYKPDNPLEFKNYLEKKLFPLLITSRVNVIVNGQRCTASEPIGKRYEFDSDKDFILGEKKISKVSNAPFGKCHGTFFITEPDESNTTHVFDRFGHRLDKYCEKDWLKLSRLTSAMAFKKRLLGTIYPNTEEVRGTELSANCLLIQSDRSGFFEQTVAYQKFVEYISSVVRIIHEEWLKEYKDLSAKSVKMAEQELPNVAFALQEILKEEDFVWKRQVNGQERNVIRKHKEHTKRTKTLPEPKNKMLQCPQCKGINYISVVQYETFVKNPSEEAKRKMSKNWPCKYCNYYLNPGMDLYKRKSPVKKPGYIVTKVKLGPGRLVNLNVDGLGTAGDLGEYNPDTEDLVINSDHAFYQKSVEVGNKALRRHMVLASLYAIAQAKEREENRKFEIEFNRLCSLAHHWTERKGIVELEQEET